MGLSDDDDTTIQQVKSKLDLTGEMDNKHGDGRITDSHRKRLQELAEMQENKKLKAQSDLKEREVEYQQGNINFIGPIPVDLPKVGKN